MRGFYSDWDVYGYFTNREEAEKYCVKNSNESFFIEEIDCLDGKEDLSNIKVGYQRTFYFIKCNKGWMEYDNSSSFYLNKSNKLQKNNIDLNINKDCLTICVNTTKNNYETQKKIAEDILYMYLESCNCKPTFKSVDDFNKLLSRSEEESEEN